MILRTYLKLYRKKTILSYNNSVSIHDQIQLSNLLDSHTTFTLTLTKAEI